MSSNNFWFLRASKFWACTAINPKTSGCSESTTDLSVAKNIETFDAKDPSEFCKTSIRDNLSQLRSNANKNLQRRGDLQARQQIFLIEAAVKARDSHLS